MKDFARIAREEYLSFLQKLYSDEVTHPDLPKNTDELNEFAQRIMKAKDVPYDISNKMLKHIAKSIEIQPQGDGQFFYTSDAYVRREAAKVLAAFSEDTRFQIHENVTFGSLPLPDLNGMCIKVPEGGYLVLVNLGTLAFCEIVANLLTGLTSFQTIHEKTKPIFTLGQAAGYFIEITSTFPMFSHMTFRRYTKFRNLIGHSNSQRNHFCSSLGDALTNFVIAHEISHFVRGHINDSKLHAVPIGAAVSNETTVEAVHYQRLQEFEADVLGSSILVLGAENTGSQVDATTAMIATQVFFLALSLMEQVKNLDSPTHPSAVERRWHLLSELDYSDDIIKVITNYEGGIFSEAKDRAVHHLRAMELAQSAYSLTNSGSLQEASNQLSEAARFASKSGDINLDFRIHHTWATTLMQLNEYKTAIDRFQHVCELVGDPKHLKDGDDILVQMARAYSEIGERDNAIINLKKAIAIVSERGEVIWEGRYLRNLGLVWAGSENYSEALRCFLKAWTILSQSNEESDRSQAKSLEEGMVRIKAMLMRQISDGKGDMNTKMRMMKELFDI